MPKHITKVEVEFEFDINDLKKAIDYAITGMIDDGEVKIEMHGEKIDWTNVLYDVARNHIHRYIIISGPDGGLDSQ